MKILHVINSLATGGAEKLLLDSLPLYHKEGITADLLLLNGIEYPFLKELKGTKGGAVFSLGTSTVYNPLYILSIIPFLKKYDLVHVHLFPAQYYAVFSKIFSRSKVKLIFTEHSVHNRRFQKKKFVRMDRFIYRRYDHIVGITPQIKDAVIAHTGISRDKVSIIKNGIVLKNIYEASPYPKRELHEDLKESDILLIQVSSFQEPKDQLTVIKSLLHLPARFKVAFVGDGVAKDKLMRATADLNLKDRVIFLGVRTDVPRLLKTADVVVLSSKYEGLSLSSIEGMASGKPFVASDVPGLREVVKDAGVLFRIGDHYQLAKEILLLANDREYYQKIVSQCLARASRFDINKMVAQHIELYEEVFRTK